MPRVELTREQLEYVTELVWESLDVILTDKTSIAIRCPKTTRYTKLVVDTAVTLCTEYQKGLKNGKR